VSVEYVPADSSSRVLRCTTAYAASTIAGPTLTRATPTPASSATAGAPYRAAREPVDLGDEAYVVELERSTAVVVRQANVVIVVEVVSDTDMTTRLSALDITAEALAALSEQR
jgi:hypothetical protein